MALIRALVEELRAMTRATQAGGWYTPPRFDQGQGAGPQFSSPDAGRVWQTSQKYLASRPDLSSDQILDLSKREVGTAISDGDLQLLRNAINLAVTGPAGKPATKAGTPGGPFGNPDYAHLLPTRQGGVP